MSTKLYPSPLFGPVHSRRLGLSLGINLMPYDGKICSFDCIYCECGRNAGQTPHSPMPTREQVRKALMERLACMQSCHRPPDSITFSGNGEPTGHPDFAGIIEDVLRVRDRAAPDAKVSVLTNSTHLDRADVFNALLKIDNVLLKLDTVDPDYIRRINCPKCRVDVPAMIERMKAFNGKCQIQTMFLEGELDGESISDTSERYVGPWLQALEEIRPCLVSIYTLARETPVSTIRKAAPETLDAIAARVKAKGLAVKIAY